MIVFVVLSSYIILSVTEAQEATTEILPPAQPDTSPEIPDKRENSPFHIPDSNKIENVDLIARGGEEYLFVRRNKSHTEAQSECRQLYDSNLATIDTKELALFLAEVIAQSHYIYENLWTAGKIGGSDNNTWVWKSGLAKDHNISEEIITILNNTNKEFSFAPDRGHCLAFGRKRHAEVLFQVLDCQARRMFICKRWYEQQSIGNSTHPGWIKLGERLYKIYPDLTTWSEGDDRCREHDADSTLAVVTEEHIEELGRLMRIGRPSIEIALVGAKCQKLVCEYPNDRIKIILGGIKTGDAEEGVIYSEYSCLAVDQHDRKTKAIQVSCVRKLPYICYKKVSPPFFERTYKDYFFEEYAYRLFLTEASWREARMRCELLSEDYHGKLAEITDEIIKDHLLYIMSDNFTSIRHIWIGGEYDFNNEKWVWAQSGQDVNKAILNWVENKTYIDYINGNYVCLNMDKENPYIPLHYGTACYARQNYICGYTTEDLRRLQRDEYLGLIPIIS